MPEALALSIEGMHCGACIRRVTDALRKIEGVRVKSVEVGSASVTFDPEQVSVEEIASGISKIGFAARTRELREEITCRVV
jgi:copper chaperone